MSKYIDLTERVKRGHGDDEVRRGIDYALEWLDKHPERVPGRTITEAELEEAVDASGSLKEFARRLGITIVPEPTNAEHDRDWWVENANVNDAEGCEACEGDLCPVHYGISMGLDLMAKKIAALGDDPELFALIPDPPKETKA